MIDNGSNRTYITSKLANILGLKNLGSYTIPVKTFNDNESKLIKMYRVEFTLRGLSNKTIHIQGNAINSISRHLNPKVPDLNQIVPNDLHHFKDQPLASENDENAEIQILIGGDYELEFLLPKQIKITDNIYLRRTIIGWIFAGRRNNNQYMIDPVTTMMALTPPIDQFATLENIGILDVPIAKDEEKAIQMFHDSIEFKDGRYHVSWP